MKYIFIRLLVIEILIITFSVDKIALPSSKPSLDFRAQWASSNNVCQLNKCPVEIVVCFRFGRQNRIHWGSAKKKLGMTFQQQLCQRPSAFIKTLSAGKCTI